MFGFPFSRLHHLAVSSRAEPCHDGGMTLLYLVSVPQRKRTIFCKYTVIATMYRLACNGEEKLRKKKKQNKQKNKKQNPI